ncbi:MAG: VCBS repeat-containing protein [Candidatus Sulfotelmatobacter sp.]
MKKYVILVAVFLTSLPGFGAQGQPKPSSQFHGKGFRPAAKANHQTAAHPLSGAAARPAASEKTIGTKAAGPFVKHAQSATTTLVPVSFVAGARSPLSGEDDDSTVQVMGDFNGDGKPDVAKIVSVTSVYNISVLLGNGDGTFQAAKLTATPNDSDDPIVVGDLKGDGTDDIIEVHPEGDTCDDEVRKPNSVRPADDCYPASSIDVLIGNGDGTFAAAVNYAISGNGLVGGLLTDVNGDGKLDVLVFDNATPANVIELLGNGDGTFQAATTLAPLSAAAPANMFFADFNGNGKLDFAGDVNGQVQVTLGTGAGTFGTPVLLITPDAVYDYCYSVAGDLTGDGKPEIVSTNCNRNTLTVYVNNGDGSFKTGVYYNNNGDQYQYPGGATIADMNGDGHNDVVVVNTEAGDISIFLGDGTGALEVQPRCYDVGGYAWNQPLVADFNGDGLLDVVESDDQYNLVYLQGYGDGTFRAAPSYDLPNSFQAYGYTFSVAAGDFNGDGIPDVVVGEAQDNGSTGVVVYLSKGDGTFYPGVSYGNSSQMRFVAVADFNGDGKLDIAATDAQAGLVQIFLGNGDGTFNLAAAYPTDSGENPNPQNVVTGDFNHDGNIDLAIANANTGSVGVLLGNGDGTFAAAASYPTTNYFPYTIATADVNGDGFLDLAVTAYSDGPPAIGILLANNDKSGTFQPVSYYNVDGEPDYVAFGDLNGDGKLDMAVTLYAGITYPGTIEIALGNGDGTFKTGVDYASSALAGGLADTEPADIQMLDLNGDGNLDLVYINSQAGTVAVALGNGDGTIAAPAEFPVTEYAWGMALADVDNDGTMDVVVGNDESGGVSVLLNGAGSGAAPNYTFGTATPSVTVTAGSAASYTLDLAGLNGYNGTITFACGELPTGATCTFNPVSVVALGGLPLTTTLSIATTARSSAEMLRPARPGAKLYPGAGSPMLLAGLSGMGLLGLLLAGSGPKGRRRRAAIVLGAVVLLTLGTLVGCDNDDRTRTITIVTPPPTGTPAGSYTVTVTSTGTGTAAPTHSLNVTLIVQ